VPDFSGDLWGYAAADRKDSLGAGDCGGIRLMRMRLIGPATLARGPCEKIRRMTKKLGPV
jgi:hypothetical protein